LLAKLVDSETMLRGSLLAHCKEVVTVAVVWGAAVDMEQIVEICMSL